MNNITKTIKERAEEFEKKHSDNIKDISIGQYNDKGVNIGFKSAEEVIKSHISHSHKAVLESVRGMLQTPRYVEDWEKSLNIKERFIWATEEQQKHIFAEVKHQRLQGGYEAKNSLLKEIDQALSDLT